MVEAGTRRAAPGPLLRLGPFLCFGEEGEELAADEGAGPIAMRGRSESRVRNWDRGGSRHANLMRMGI
jgi:hypothetical protein